jgi:hypothetical protein
MSLRHFDGLSGLDQIPLIYDLEVTPAVIGGYSGPKLLIGNKKPQFYSWLEEATGPLEGLTKGLTVAQAAFLLLAAYEASPIILIGQDLSFEREGGKTHADGVAFQGRFIPGQGNHGQWEDPLDPRGLEEVPILQVPANDGGVLPTTHTLFTYLKRFEDDIRQSGAQVINATEGGALIQGTRIATLRETLDQYLPTLPAGSFRGLIPSDSERHIQNLYGPGLRKILSDMVALLEKAKILCEETYDKTDKFRRDLKWKDFNEKDLSRRFDEIQKVYSWIAQTPKIQMLIDRGVMRSLYMLHKGDLPSVDERTKEDCWTVLERYGAFFTEALGMIRLDLSLLNEPIPSEKDHQ